MVAPEEHSNLIGKPFPVLDQGFIKLVDVMGSDARVVEAARLTSKSEGRSEQDDERLLRYLMRKRHDTPFEFAGVTLHWRCPMDMWRQIIRHRLASVNEHSTRYSPPIDAMAKTDQDQWRRQSKRNRQGSSGAVVEEWPEDLTSEQVEQICQYMDCDESQLRQNASPGAYLRQREEELHNLAKEIYEERRAFGVAKEVARKDLPLSTYTEAYWEMDLRGLLHFLGLRMDPHAQQEARAYANVIGYEIVSKIFPWSWRAFLDYRLNASLLTALDIHAVRNITSVNPDLPISEEAFLHLYQPSVWRSLKRCRERDECVDKLRHLELIA